MKTIQKAFIIRRINILLSSFFIVFFVSCRKELEKPSWDTQILAPLISSTLTINNILPDSVLQSNADSSLKIVYQNDIYRLSMDTLFKIHDTTIHNGYGLFGSVVFNPGQIIPFPSVASTTYPLPGVQLRKVVIKSGSINFKVINKIREITTFTYSIPCATLGGTAFSVNVNVPARTGSTPGIYNQTFDLSGYAIDLTGPAHDQINTIYTSVGASISSSAADTVLVIPSDSLIIDNTFSGITPYYALGYFGENTFNIGPSESNFTFFKKITDGTIHFEDINFNLKLTNPIGMDARVYINNLKSINTRTGTSYDLINSLIGSPININRASESGGTVFPTYANFPLTPSNSNIVPMIENLPDKFGYAMQIITNPLGNVSGSNDFIYSDQLMKASLNMEIPLSLVATNLTLVDTINLNISNSDGNQNIHSGTITLFADNGFPFDASLQLYLLNDLNGVTDSLFGYANTIDEAPLNSSLRAIGKKLTKIAIPLSESKMSLLYSTKKVMLKVRFNTSSQPNYIRIYSDYSIYVKLVGDFNYTVQLH